MSSDEGTMSFPFINVTPGSATDSAYNRLLVRSHVGSWVWQQTKQNSGASDTDEVDDIHTQGVKSSTHRADWNSIKLEVATSLSSSTPLAISCQTPDLMTDQMSSCGHDDNGLDLSRNSNALSPYGFSLCGSLHSIDYIGGEKLDLFQTNLSNNFPPGFVNWCTKYWLSVVLPGLMPSSVNGPRSAAILSWFQPFWHDSNLFTIFLFGAVSHKRLHCLRKENTADISRPPDNKLLIFLELESIKRVNEAIQSPSRVLNDTVIISVMCLVNNRADELMYDDNLRSPFESPLRDLQWLDIYGRLTPNPVHLSGLAQLIKLREGLEQIKLPGLAPIISHSDILAASKTLSCPLFPFIPLGDTNPTMQDQLGLAQPDLNYRFMMLYTVGFTAELAEVFQVMKAFTCILEKYQDGSTTEPDLCRISNQRNFVQHRLLSLLPAGKLDWDFRKSHPVYEICRLAGLIFGVGVIFPLPVQTTPLPTLVKHLQAELQEPSLESAWWFPDAVEILIWVLTLGGIAATGLPNRIWFVATLGRVSACSGLSNWRDLKLILDRMLWLDSACNVGGQQLWEEVSRLKLSKLGVW